MSESACPLTAAEIVDLYFLEHRARLLDIAAFLDRIDRASDAPRPADHRVEALRACIALLDDGKGDRARRIQILLSDHTSEPIDAAPMQGATGAPEPEA